MKKTAVLVFPLMSIYEISVALSAMAQAQRAVTFFSLTQEPVRCEENLPVKPDQSIHAPFDIEEYDSLLISGSMDPPTSYLNDDSYLNFVRRFNRPQMVIGAISSGPILLSMSGILTGKRYTCGVPLEYFDQVKLNRALYDDKATFVEDGGILTAPGWHYVDFGIRFCEMLKLDFDPKWYK